MESLRIKSEIEKGINKIYKLVYGSDILGFRVIAKGRVFDMDIDYSTLSQYISQSLESIEELKLKQDKNGNLITSYEEDFGVEVEAVTNTKKIFQFIESNFRSDMYVMTSTPSSNGFLGIDDEVERVDVEIVEPKYIEILKKAKSGVGLDISVVSTGVTVWYNGELEHYIISVEGLDSESERKEAFREYLTELLGGREFEYICVEDVYGGENFKTTRDLLSLNTVIDEIISDGTIKCEKLFREPNTSWKAILREYGKLGGKPKDKIEIQWMLKNLDVNIEAFERFNTADKKDRDQDIMDSLGLLIAVVSREKSGKGRKLKKLGIKNMNMSYCVDVLEYEDTYGGNFIELQVEKNLIKELEDEITRTKGEVTILAQVPITMVGRLLLELNIDTFFDEVCIVAEPKKSRMQKHKKKKTIGIIR